jgi:pyridinium-3,5-biscarboxylic acid mononucleotide synthase
MRKPAQRFKDLDFAKVEPRRYTRQGFPEAIYCPGKTIDQIVPIFESLLKGGAPVIATRATADVSEVLLDHFKEATHHPIARLVTANSIAKKSGRPVLVICAGTADLPVAEEAAVTLETLGRRVTRLFDVGVSGIHRLMAHEPLLRRAAVAVVCAGMEGALPSVVGGLAACPVIAVPTSVGYGTSFQGVTALLGMLNSCAANVSAVNIDNGFGAGVIASLISKE